MRRAAPFIALFVVIALPPTDLGATRVVRVLVPESEMVVVPAGVFGMGIDELELKRARDACAEEYGGEVGAEACSEIGI